jgi:sulfite exporter TauE/SafE
VTDFALPASLFAMGLASGLHCLGMCGGIAAAFPLNRALFNAGRIATYGIVGLAAGTLGGVAARFVPAQAALYFAVNVVLILVGLHIAGFTAPIRGFERIGAPLWRRVPPLVFKKNSFVAGMAWGLIPCGLVYAAATASAFAATPLGSAAAMLAFGLGTLPWLLAAGVAAARLRGWLRVPAVRYAMGGGVLAFGVIGIARADIVQQTFFCL